jgi:very-short-patch-repair endonuclease
MSHTISTLFTPPPRLPALVEERVGRLAAHQRGLISRAQAHGVGLNRVAIDRRLRAGRWTAVHPDVYRLAGSAPSWVGDVWAAVLACGSGATVSHETALALHGSPHVPGRPITVTVDGGPRRPLSGVVVHPPGAPPAAPAHVVVVEDLPVASPPRALLEVAGRLRPRALARALDDLVFDRRTTYAAVGACLAARAGPTTPGAAALGSLLDDRSPAAVPPASELERALFTALDAAGLPPPRRQMPLPGRGGVEGTVDAAYPDCRLILEADGRRWHTRVAALRRDHERDAEAARAGWQTLRFLYEQVVHHPADVCAVVADVRAVRAGLGHRSRPTRGSGR